LPSKGLKKKQQITLSENTPSKKNKFSFAHRLNKKTLQEHCTLIPEIHNIKL
jgi:hypothetical protein